MSDATESEATLAQLACWQALHSHLHIWRNTQIQHYSVSSKYAQLPETTLPLILSRSMSGASESELCWQALHSHLHAWRNTWTQHYGLLSNYTQLPKAPQSCYFQCLAWTDSLKQHSLHWLVDRLFALTWAPSVTHNSLKLPSQHSCYTQLLSNTWLLLMFCCCCLMSSWGEQT